MVRWYQEGWGVQPRAFIRHGQTITLVRRSFWWRGIMPLIMWSGRYLSRYRRSDRLLSWGSSEQLLPVEPAERAGS